jgi:acryloyl-coenzyme A reductase
VRVVAFADYGPPEVLQVGERPDPEPGPGDVLVAIEAAGVCHHDALHRAGRLPTEPADMILGHEIAGRVVEVGGVVDMELVGTRVVVNQQLSCGSCRRCLAGRRELCRRSVGLGNQVDGGYAEYVAVPAANVVPVPDGLDWTTAALASCPLGASVRALLGVAAMRPGDSVLITGASGGLGMHQIQLVKALGGTAFAVSSSPAKAGLLREAGADHVVVSPSLDYSAEVWRLTGKTGVDITLENVGQTLPESLRATTAGGIVVVLGNLEVHPVDVSPALLIGRSLRIAGSGNVANEDIRQALALLASGAVCVHVDRVLRFPQAAAAHRLLEERAVSGRVVLRGW